MSEIITDYTLTGKEYGQLKVLEKISSGRYANGTVYHDYNCECSCGNFVKKRSINLVNGNAICCKKCAFKKVSNTTKIGKIPSRIKCSIKYRSDNKNLPSDVNDEFLWDLFQSQNGKCALTGVDIGFAEFASDSKSTTASLDRIDSSKGYTKDNVQWVHKTINKMKLDMTQDEFIYWCQLIVRNDLC